MLRLVQPSMLVVGPRRGLGRVLGLAATMAARRRRDGLGSGCVHATVAVDSVRRCRRRRPTSSTCDCCPYRHGLRGRHARLGRPDRLGRLGPRARLDCCRLLLCLLSAAAAVLAAAVAVAGV